MTAAIPAVKERPIIFSGSMVRAILEGRKTQTRRILRPKAPSWEIGTHLWVRERWAPHDDKAIFLKERDYLYYRADDETKYETDGAWHNPIFMPRWASRLTLEITEVRVERVQDISEEDARAEGCEPWGLSQSEIDDIQISDDPPEVKELARALGPGFMPARSIFQMLWQDIHGKESWDSNPSVRCISFKRVTP